MFVKHEQNPRITKEKLLKYRNQLYEHVTNWNGTCAGLLVEKFFSTPEADHPVRLCRLEVEDRSTLSTEEKCPLVNLIHRLTRGVRRATVSGRLSPPFPPRRRALTDPSRRWRRLIGDEEEDGAEDWSFISGIFIFSSGDEEVAVSGDEEVSSRQSHYCCCCGC